MAKGLKEPVPEFKYPQDFVAVKGRHGQVYCKICTPPDRAQGQLMSPAAALRHERENEKHRSKFAELALWDFTREVEADWSDAWEGEPYVSERVEAFINFWLDGIEAEEREEEQPRMEALMEEYGQAFETEYWPVKFEDWPQDADDEEEQVQGAVYPRYTDTEIGYNWPDDDCYLYGGWWTDEETQERRWYLNEDLIKIVAAARPWYEHHEADWGPLPGEEGATSEAEAGAVKEHSNPSDATPPQSPERSSQQKRRRRRGSRGRGKQAGKGVHAPENVLRRMEAWHKGARPGTY
ncbi:hypothetical protein C2E23DRAFT_880851 [Lenzites betulinus]|nr:hypothetical protein C2E23DRAFT_880851 [Lenzites betulinus]